jgi:hypothetical protein
MNMSYKLWVVLVMVALLAAACAAPVEPVETAVDTQMPAIPYPYPGPEQGRVRPSPTSPYPEPVSGGNIVTQEPAEMSESEFLPADGDEKLERSVVFLELDSSQIIIMESYPVQVNVILRGSLPTPCHLLRVIPSEPDKDQNISLEVYSLADPSLACITVIKPFVATISLGSFTGGTYTILVNGELLGEFDA